jgi:hypothetical protein
MLIYGPTGNYKFRITTVLLFLVKVCTLLAAWLILRPKYEGSTFLRNVSKIISDYVALLVRTRHFFARNEIAQN